MVFLGHTLPDRGKISKFYWELRKRVDMKMKWCTVGMDRVYVLLEDVY